MFSAHDTDNKSAGQHAQAALLAARMYSLVNQSHFTSVAQAKVEAMTMCLQSCVDGKVYSSFRKTCVSLKIPQETTVVNYAMLMELEAMWIEQSGSSDLFHIKSTPQGTIYNFKTAWFN